MDIFRGNPHPQECNDWVRRFIDGLKYLFAGLIYSIPIIIVLILTFFPVFMELIRQVTSKSHTIQFDTFIPYVMPVIGGIIVAIILWIIITLICTIGIIRMARMNRFVEAFNIREIIRTIQKIGWSTYLVALVIIYVISLIIGFGINLVMEAPFIGFIIALFLWPLLTIFESRYFTLLYEESGE